MKNLYLQELYALDWRDELALNVSLRVKIKDRYSPAGRTAVIGQFRVAARSLEWPEAKVNAWTAALGAYAKELNKKNKQTTFDFEGARIAREARDARGRRVTREGHGAPIQVIVEAI